MEEGQQEKSRKVTFAETEEQGDGYNASAEMMARAKDAFGVFDHDQNNSVDAREVPTILRSLGLCPSEADVQGLVRDMEDPKQLGTIRLDRFLPVATKVLSEKRFPTSDADSLLNAVAVLIRNNADNKEGNEGNKDKVGKEHKEEEEQFEMPERISVARFRDLFTMHGGEPLRADEIEEMLTAAMEPTTKSVNLRDFVNQLIVDEDALDVYHRVN